MMCDTLPSNFPPGLATVAFSWGDEKAWSPDHAVLAVEWFGSHGYAILGTELWVVQTDGIQTLPSGQDGKRGVYGNTVNRQKGESWNSFVVRSTTETREYLQAFDRSDIAEPGQLYFNVVWVNESGFKELGAMTGAIKNKILSHPIVFGMLLSVPLTAVIIIVAIWFPRIGKAVGRHILLLRDVCFTILLFCNWVSKLWSWHRRRMFWPSFFLLFLFHTTCITFVTLRFRPLSIWEWMVLGTMESYLVVGFIYRPLQRSSASHSLG